MNWGLDYHLFQGDGEEKDSSKLPASYTEGFGRPKSDFFGIAAGSGFISNIELGQFRQMIKEMDERPSVEFTVGDLFFLWELKFNLANHQPAYGTPQIHRITYDRVKDIYERTK